MLYRTLITINGKGTILLPRGRECKGVKWLKERIRPSISGHIWEYWENKFRIIDQALWDAIVEKYGQEGTLKELNLSDCYFFNVKFDNICFQDVDFTNSFFSFCEFSNLLFSECGFKKATVYDSFNSCTFTQCDFTESGIYHCKFTGCRIERCDFSGSTMRHITFYMSTLVENELYDCTMDTVYFTGSKSIDNKSISHIRVTMGGARYDEVAAHKTTILNALTA